ncbi:MAG: hypothetical protein M1822_009470 [Bathelium mastoideum]|nr:MAG: hypothetical protein M1822_009470 [Bathelium mastoideum]
MAPLDMTIPTTNKSPLKGKKRDKSRSKSIGPGGTDALRDDANAANRRKSAFIPQSILPSKEDEQKRREARRKSLANRRVSFAPEATLHTWDVIEYMRDATTSSASSESTRRASNLTSSRGPGSPAKISQSHDDGVPGSEPPSTPPEQVEDAPRTVASPAHQRGLHQKKRRRRSSGIPPMNFNNPDDVYSSSPLSGESAVGSSPFNAGADEDGSGDDGNSTAMSLVTDVDETTVTGRMSTSSEASSDSTGSSARLEAALRQAAETAGTQALGLDESGDATMEIADDSVTDAFQPWMHARQAQLRAGGSPIKHSAKMAPVLEKDKENTNPFSPAFKAGTAAAVIARNNERGDQDDDVSMEITRAMGGIMAGKQKVHMNESTLGDATMDLTVAVGHIQGSTVDLDAQHIASSKRRRTLSSGSPLKVSKESQGSPASRRLSRNAATSRRRSSGIASNLDDKTMEFTTAVGGIQQNLAKSTENRRASAVRRRSSADASVPDDDDEPMDLTMAIGAIEDNDNNAATSDDDPSLNSNEELSMELTTVIGGIRAAQDGEQEKRPETPITEASHEASTVASTPKDQTRFKEVDEITPKKLTPILEKQVPYLEIKTPPKRPRKSPRASLGRSSLHNVEPAMDLEPAEEERVAPATPQIQVEHIAEDDKENDPPSPSPRKTPAIGSAKKLSATPEKGSAMKETKALSESMRLLSTPRKEVSQSPLKRLAGTTPKKQATPRIQSPLKKGLTPLKRASPTKSVSPNKKVQMEKPSISPVKQDEKIDENEADAEAQNAEASPPPRIQLQEFLDMTSIRFMDLTTTKRRHTAAPSAFTTKGADLPANSSSLSSSAAGTSLESRVIAGACTVPTLEMFQHACRELKQYLASGHGVVEEIAAAVAERPPPLFGAYMSASRAQRAALDAQLVAAKTHARLLSKGMWYEWRGQLLKGLRQGLEGIGQELEGDARLLGRREEMIESVLPGLGARREELLAEKQVLEEQAKELDGIDKEELEEAREGLVDVENELEEKRRMLERLQEDMKKKQEAIEMAQERKTEMMAEIKEAERVREECRGWSAAEVRELQGKALLFEKLAD